VVSPALCKIGELVCGFGPLPGRWFNLSHPPGTVSSKTTNSLWMQESDNCPYSNNDKINTDNVIKYPGKYHYDDTKNERDNSPK
jgi:hypothetical protein